MQGIGYLVLFKLSSTRTSSSSIISQFSPEEAASVPRIPRIEVRLINPLFLPMPDPVPEGKDFLSYINPEVGGVTVEAPRRNPGGTPEAWSK